MPSRVSPEGRRRADPPALWTTLWVVLGLAVIGGSLLAGFLVFGTDGGTDAGARPSIAPLTSAPASPGESPDESPSESPSATSDPSGSPTPESRQPTAAGMTMFLSDYLRDVADDPAGAWGDLTPGFQRSSGGFASYRSFWAPITDARTSDVRADPSSRTIAYDVRYTYADGHTTTDSTRLTLVYDDGTYRISGEG